MLALAPRLGPFSPPPTPSCAQVLAELARTQRPALAPQRQRLCAALAPLVPAARDLRRCRVFAAPAPRLRAGRARSCGRCGRGQRDRIIGYRHHELVRFVGLIGRHLPRCTGSAGRAVGLHRAAAARRAWARGAPDQRTYGAAPPHTASASVAARDSSGETVCNLLRPVALPARPSRGPPALCNPFAGTIRIFGVGRPASGFKPLLEWSILTFP